MWHVWRGQRRIPGFVGKLDRNRPLERPRRSGRIILKRILTKHNGEKRGLDLPGSEQEQIAGSCEHVN